MVYKLMVVDDSNIIRNRIKRGFNAMQFELVATASNGVEALEQFKRHGPDVVTMDLTMPEMDGLECIRNIMDINPDTLILVISEPPRVSRRPNFLREYPNEKYLLT